MTGGMLEDITARTCRESFLGTPLGCLWMTLVLSSCFLFGLGVGARFNSKYFEFVCDGTVDSLRHSKVPLPHAEERGESCF